MTRAASRTYDSRRRSRERGTRASGTGRRIATRPARSIIAPPTTIRIEIADQAFEATLPPQGVRVGSDEACELRLQASGIGARQCAIEALPDGRHLVRDLGSGYPTLVNGLEVHQVSLRPGDVLTVGEARIVYAPVPVPVPRPTPSPAPAPAGSSAPPSKRANGNGKTPAPAPASSRSHQRLVGPLVAMAAAAVLAVGLAFVLGSGGQDGDEAGAELRLERALDLYREQDFVGAREELARIVDDPDAGKMRRKAERYLDRVVEAIRGAERELDRLWAQRLDFDPLSVEAAREAFLQKHGPGFATRYDEVMARIGEAQAAWIGEAVAKAREESDRYLAGEQFAHARGVWLSLRGRRRAGANTSTAIDEALTEIRRAASGAASVLLAEATLVDASHGPQAAARQVRTRLENFAGTEAYATLADAIATYEAEHAAALVAAAPTVPIAPEVPEPGTPTTPQPPDPDLRERAEAALAAAELRVKARDFQGGLDALDVVLGGTVPAGAIRTALEARQQDLVLARDGLDALAADITAQPDKYRRVEMGTKFFVALRRADRESVTGAISGGETRYRWASLGVDRIASIATRMQAEGRAALGLASCLREVGVADVHEALLHAAADGVEAVDTATIFAIVARWRGETVPPDGYVAYEQRWMTPTERDRRVLEARVREAVAVVHGNDPEKRREAYEELLSLGAPARKALVAALQSRRASAIEEVAGMKVFTGARTKNRLFQELERRRAHALALIQDAGAWPYPNPSGRNTEEVVARVDAVRQIWENPFDLIAEWNAEVGGHLALVTEVDEILVRAEPGYKPTLDALRERVARSVDMPTFTPTSQSASVREYSLKVLAYNVKLDTTATHEEKECVRAVNEYRMMMGRNAVKINERLTRAARGHSRHMRVNGYFAHNVPSQHGPDGTNRTPGDRARTQGYGGGVGENIARGSLTGRDAFWAWFHSSGHHRNMINAGWTEMGAGRSGGSWWTQLFGAKSGRSLSAPDALPDPPPPFAPEAEDERGRPLRPGENALPDEAPPGMPDRPETPGEGSDGN